MGQKTARECNTQDNGHLRFVATWEQDEFLLYFYKSDDREGIFGTLIWRLFYKLKPFYGVTVFILYEMWTAVFPRFWPNSTYGVISHADYDCDIHFLIHCSKVTVYELFFELRNIMYIKSIQTHYNILKMFCSAISMLVLRVEKVIQIWVNLREKLHPG